MHKTKLPVIASPAEVKTKVYEDNSGALEMAKNPKYCPQAKHMNVRLHHFRDHVARGEITTHPISTKDQLAGYLTKPVNEPTLLHLHKTVMGW